MRKVFRLFSNSQLFEVLLIGIPLTYLLVLAGFPVLFNAYIAFHDVDFFNLGAFDWDFIYFDNFVELFQYSQFKLILLNTAKFLFFSIFFQFSIGFGLALFFRQKFVGAHYLRGMFLAAWIMPVLVTGVIWKWILSGDSGVLNYLLQSLGILSENIFWTASQHFSLASVILANIWLGIPFNMILLTVGLMAIPEDLYEAARIDAANAFQRFYRITLPLMRSTIGSVLALGVIYTLQQFDLVAGMTSGGPANASNVFQYWAWELSFVKLSLGQGAAISILMIVVVLLVAVIYVRSLKAETKY